MNEDSWELNPSREWDFDPKFRTGSISEETPNEKRRREFYAEHAGEILSVFNASIAGTPVYIETTSLMNYCALVVSELANRAGETGCLQPGDPEFGNASCIDEL